MKKLLPEMAYPSTFNMDTLLGLSSYKKRLDYVRSILPRLAQGSARMVFAIDEERVLKVAMNRKGINQNEVEASLGNDYMAPDILASVFEHDDNYIFVEMERAKKVLPTKFKQILGFTVNDLHSYLFNMSSRRGGFSLDSKLENILDESEWVQDLVEFIGNFDLPSPGDFGRLSTYGLVLRDGKEEIVIVDYGFNKSTKALYSR
jgi:hypothetical protein